MPKSSLIPKKNIKKKVVVISCTYTHPFKCVVRIFIFFKKNLKTLKKRKKKKKIPKFNLILSHANHTCFYILGPLIGPQAFKHNHCTLEEKNSVLKCEERSNSRSNLLQGDPLAFFGP